MSFARTALRAPSALRQTPRLTRSYAQEGVAGKEPINQERGNSKTPFYIVGALAVLAGGYFVGYGQTPPTPAVKGIQQAMAPKTPQAKEAAGMKGDPQDEPTKAGGDQKAKQ